MVGITLVLFVNHSPTFKFKFFRFLALSPEDGGLSVKVADLLLINNFYSTSPPVSMNQAVSLLALPNCQDTNSLSP
jgi:hypothetical protein